MSNFINSEGGYLAGTFAVVPAEILYSTGLTPFQKFLITILIYLTFRGRRDIDSNVLAAIANVNRDHLRRQLREIQRRFTEGDGVPQNFINLYFVKSGFNIPDAIVFHKNYENKTLVINNGSQEKFSNNDLIILERFLAGSKYFKESDGRLLFKLAGTGLDELIKGILYTDAQKTIKDPIAYLRTCYKNGFFKYEKIYNSLPVIDSAKYVFSGKEISGYITPVKIKGNIAAPFVFGITLNDFETLKAKKTDEYKFHIIKDLDKVIIYKSTLHSKDCNTQKALEKFEIPYTIHLRADDTPAEQRRRRSLKKLAG